MGSGLIFVVPFHCSRGDAIESRKQEAALAVLVKNSELSLFDTRALTLLTLLSTLPREAAETQAVSHGATRAVGK